MKYLLLIFLATGIGAKGQKPTVDQYLKHPERYGKATYRTEMIDSLMNTNCGYISHFEVIGTHQVAIIHMPEPGTTTDTIPPGIGLIFESKQRGVGVRSTATVSDTPHTIKANSVRIGKDTVNAALATWATARIISGSNMAVNFNQIQVWYGGKIVSYKKTDTSEWVITDTIATFKSVLHEIERQQEQSSKILKMYDELYSRYRNKK